MNSETMELINTILTLTNKVIEMIEQGDIEDGYIEYLDSINYDIKGVCIKSTRVDEYNLYTPEQYNLLYNLAMMINGAKDKFEKIKSTYMRALCLNLLEDIVDKIDMCLLNQRLFPIFSYIKDNRTGRYIIATY
jgi:hypothetical protein